MITDKINTENIILSLFSLGFEEVNSVQYTKVLGYLSKNQLLKDFDLVDKELSSTFHEFFEFDGNTFKFQKGISLSTDYFKKYDQGHQPKTLGIELANQNKRLIFILKSVINDISDIMISHK